MIKIKRGNRYQRNGIKHIEIGKRQKGERKFKAREFIIIRNRQHNLNNWLNQGTQYNIS